MQARLDGRGGRQFLLDMPLADFLDSRLMQRQAEACLCESGADLLRDYIGDTYGPSADDEEMTLVLAEALELASDYAVHSIELEPADVAYARKRLHPGWKVTYRRAPTGPLVA